MLAALLGGALLAQPCGAASLMRRVARIPLPGVQGRIDHLALDPDRRRLFVAALGNDSLEVVDLEKARRVGRVEGLREPQGVLYVSGEKRLYVTLGGGAAVAVLDGSDLAILRRIASREDPDNIRYEAGPGHVWLGAGTGRGAALLALGGDPRHVVSEIALAGHPESFQLETSGPRVFVNVPGERAVEVADRRRGEVFARWALPCAANFPMALDEENGRLYVGCRRPARIVVLDTATGRVVAGIDAPGDADDLFLDPAAHRLYVSGGEGIVRTYELRAADRLEAAGDVSTGSGARTSLFDAQAQRLYVAVPHRGAAPAEIQVFDTKT